MELVIPAEPGTELFGWARRRSRATLYSSASTPSG
jgi:hypothetical protein